MNELREYLGAGRVGDDQTDQTGLAFRPSGQERTAALHPPDNSVADEYIDRLADGFPGGTEAFRQLILARKIPIRIDPVSYLPKQGLRDPYGLAGLFPA